MLKRLLKIFKINSPGESSSNLTFWLFAGGSGFAIVVGPRACVWRTCTFCLLCDSLLPILCVAPEGRSRLENPLPESGLCFTLGHSRELIQHSVYSHGAEPSAFSYLVIKLGSAVW